MFILLAKCINLDVPIFIALLVCGTQQTLLFVNLTQSLDWKFSTRSVLTYQKLKNVCSLQEFIF